MPPAMHPVPVAHLPMVEPGERVTVAMPGNGRSRVWLVDTLTVSSGPHDVDGEDAYFVTAVCEPGAASVRHLAAGGHTSDPVEVVDRRVPARDLWVYRDETAQHSIAELPERSETDWLEKVGDGSTPPVRKPRPARELPRLVGQRVRVPDVDGGWSWYVAVTEPLSQDGEIVLGVAAERHYWQAVYGAPPEDRWVLYPALHTCWSY